jgi:hypothetical protein
MEYCSSIKKNKIMFACRNTDGTRIIRLSKISQIQKDKYHSFSHTQNLDFKNNMKVERGLFGGTQGFNLP